MKPMPGRDKLAEFVQWCVGATSPAKRKVNLRPQRATNQPMRARRMDFSRSASGLGADEFMRYESCSFKKENDAASGSSCVSQGPTNRVRAGAAGARGPRAPSPPSRARRRSGMKSIVSTRRTFTTASMTPWHPLYSIPAACFHRHSFHSRRLARGGCAPGSPAVPLRHERRRQGADCLCAQDCAGGEQAGHPQVRR